VAAKTHAEVRLQFKVQYASPPGRSKNYLPLFPIFLKLRGRQCLVVGAGKIGEAKIAGLLEAGAHVVVIAPQATPRIEEWGRNKKIRLKRRKFQASDLHGVFLVVAAANSPKVHREIYRHAKARKALCNIVDVPALCDFYYPAVVRRGNLQIAISTEGSSPSLAKRLRQELESSFGPGYAAWLKHLTRERKKVRVRKLPAAQRLKLLERQASAEAFARFLKRQPKTDHPRKSR
jgi:precorrin-2 dehydrogenase/sirohydrochlorin ferrochelatase